MAELEIIGVAQSNYVWAVRIAATEKGVPYKFTPLRPNTAEVGAIHPFSKIPVMRHGDFELFESKAIATYIDRTFDGPALIPADAKGAALTEQWISCVNTLIDPTCVRQYIVSYVFPGTPDGSPNRAKIDAALPAMEKQLAVLDKALARNGHLVGDTLTFADMNLFPIAFYLQRFPESKAMVQSQKHLTGFIERMLARPSVKATTPPPPPKKD
jgi:glutathione S-transferase